MRTTFPLILAYNRPCGGGTLAVSYGDGMALHYDGSLPAAASS